MPNQKHDGARRPYHVSPEDKGWVRKRLNEKKMSKAELAKRAGMTRQNIYLLLDGEATFTYEWPAIVAALGGTPPSGVLPLIDDRLREIIRRWPDLSETDKLMVEQMARRFGAKKS